MELGLPLSEGVLDGAELGYKLPLGSKLGLELGTPLGFELGTVVGTKLGIELGALVGSRLVALGFLDGAPDGRLVFLHLLLQVAGQKNLRLLPSCSFLHLLTGCDATYESHVLSASPSKRNVSLFSHGPRILVGDPEGRPVFLHLRLQVAGQKNLRFLPSCSFLHLLTGCDATYESHVLSASPSKRNVSLFSHGPRVSVGDVVGAVVEATGDEDGCEYGELDTASSFCGCAGCCDGPDDIISVGCDEGHSVRLGGITA
jgi:hypothetical protein